MSGLKRGSVAIVGAAESDLGQVAPHTSPVDLMAQATMRALDDCGLKLSDIDGVFSAATQVRTAPMTLDRKSTRLNSSHIQKSRMPSSA